MKRILLPLLLAAATGAVYAHNCPNEMKAIDAKLSSASGISAENLAKAKTLRADGEKLHKEGKHDESMKALGDAKKLLGI